MTRWQIRARFYFKIDPYLSGLRGNQRTISSLLSLNIVDGTVVTVLIVASLTVLVYQHRAFSSTRYAEVKEQIKATQMAVAQINTWQLQIATYLKIELAKPQAKVK